MFSDAPNFATDNVVLFAREGPGPFCRAVGHACILTLTMMQKETFHFNGGSQDGLEPAAQPVRFIN